ncbi:hypothetical protein CLOHYLEM_07514 [[Clostridium] hylemonae DSM 15053]|uniref:Uncharacterized protein n=1 Tax=[Clostridium] hylemonae DSM 15053 TaxID=553973 RepID=C0C5X6_9FIRM|nr:hypothetical protein CLOHYLEM_07514 [[Clostridium] hylemonae DSM 15053]
MGAVLSLLLFNLLPSFHFVRMSIHLCRLKKETFSKRKLFVLNVSVVSQN